MIESLMLFTLSEPEVPVLFFSSVSVQDTAPIANRAAIASKEGVIFIILTNITENHPGEGVHQFIFY